MNMYQQQAREAVPELQALIKAHKAARAAAMQPISFGLPSPSELAQRVREALLAGDDQPTDNIGTQILAYQQAMDAAKLQRSTLMEIANTLDSEREQLEADRANDMLAALKPHLEDILDSAKRLVGELKGARTAGEAISGGTFVVEAWSGLEELARNYDELRAAQWKITRNGWAEHAGSLQFMQDNMGMHTALCNITEVWDTCPLWPHDEHRPRHAPRSDREFLVWAALNPNNVWLPTIPELLDSLEEYQEATQQQPVKLDPGIVRRQSAARARQHA